MRTAGLWVAILPALLAAPASGKTKARPRSKPDVVALRFGWQPGLTADVTYRRTRSTTGKPTDSVSCRARLSVEADGKNLRVGYRDWNDEGGGGAPAGEPPPSTLARGATIVNKRGDLVRVDLTSLDEVVRAAAANKASPEARKEWSRMLPVMVKERAVKTWQMLVESWTDAELEIGVDLETDIEGPTDLVPGGKVKTNLRFRADRWLDCPGRPGKRCVELKLRSEPDRESLAKLVAAVGARLGHNDWEATARDLVTVEEITLVTEPDRMIPHRLDVTKTVGPREGGAGGVDDVVRVERTTWTYQYASEPR